MPEAPLKESIFELIEPVRASPFSSEQGPFSGGCSVCTSESLGAHSDSRAVLPMCDSTLHELPVSGSACYLLLPCREP